MQAFPVGEKKPAVAIVGCGTVGTAIGRLLGDAGYRISGVATSNLETARRAAEAAGSEGFSDCPWEISRGADVVFVTTPDDLIRSTFMSIS
jgi:ketol-acid reductoisomerase